MALSFLTSLDEQEFKAFLKEALKEVLSEVLTTVKEETADVLDIEQAAKYLHLQITTIYEKTSKKLIPHFKKGNRLYFKRAELDQWLSEGKVKTREELRGEVQTERMNND